MLVVMVAMTLAKEERAVHTRCDAGISLLP
jgi:hypothetical protein